MLGCPYAHAEYIGALLADALGYGYLDVRYSAPSPPISQHVTIALDNPMTVTYRRCPHQSPRRPCRPAPRRAGKGTAGHQS